MLLYYERLVCTVLMPRGGVCRNPTRDDGLLSSVVSATTGCGSPTTPWLIDVGPGQRVNVSLIDFGSPAPGFDQTNTSLATSRTHCQVCLSCPLHNHSFKPYCSSKRLVD